MFGKNLFWLRGGSPPGAGWSFLNKKAARRNLPWSLAVIPVSLPCQLHQGREDGLLCSLIYPHKQCLAPSRWLFPKVPECLQTPQVLPSRLVSISDPWLAKEGIGHLHLFDPPVLEPGMCSCQGHKGSRQLKGEGGEAPGKWLSTEW